MKVEEWHHGGIGMVDFIQCRQAAKIVAELQEWIEDRDGLSTVPSANLSWSVKFLLINIGHMTVWSSEENDSSELSFEFCRDKYLEEIRDFLPFLNNEQ